MDENNTGLLSNKIFNFIFGCAMHDATLQQAFKGKKDWIGKVVDAQKPLTTYIDKVLKNEFKSQKDHVYSFLKTANAICKCINDKKPGDAQDSFSFGNAQKLINITVKHFYTVCYVQPNLRVNFRYCHCPMDSIMLDEVWKRYKKRFSSQVRKKNLGSDFCASWGDEGLENGVQAELDIFPERYIKYQQAIKKLIDNDNVYPIEFDYLTWKQQ